MKSRQYARLAADKKKNQQKWLAAAIYAASLFASHAVMAENVPIVRTDAEACTLRPWHQLGGCFQNKTGKRIQDDRFYYRQSIYYNDKRTKIVALIEMNPTGKNNYLVVSTAPEVLRQNHISKVVNELVSAKTAEGNIISGCSFEITETAPVLSLALSKNGNTYSC